jgi:hypothetical protein
MRGGEWGEEGCIRWGRGGRLELRSGGGGRGGGGDGGVNGSVGGKEGRWGEGGGVGGEWVSLERENTREEGISLHCLLTSLSRGLPAL